jgi:two-component system cell cycle sensor histidine kinase/response regulator CckA
MRKTESSGSTRVSHPALSPNSLTRTAVTLAPRALILAVLAVAVLAIGLAVPPGVIALMLFVVSATLAVTAVVLRVVAGRHARSRDSLHGTIAAFVAHDAAPSFTTDEDGEIGYQNHAALERFGSRGGQTLTRALGEVFANPAAVLHRMQNKAAARGAAREDMVTRRGHVRLAVHQMAEGAYLWRLEDMAERAVGGRGAESISLPMLTVSKSGTILFMNEALRRLVGERVKTLDRIFTELPLRSGESHEILGAEGPVRALVVEIDGAGGRQEVFLLPVPESGLGASQADMSAFDALPVALMRLSAVGTVTEVNRAARALLGPIEGDLTLAQIFEGLGRSVDDWLSDALSGRADGQPEVLRTRRSEKEAFVQVTLSRVSNDGRPGLIAVMSDATQLKTLEAQFVQSQKMQAIGQLAGGVAHDFNNLLTAISGHCDLLLLRHDKADPDYADLVQINQNANRAASLVGQLLAFSRKQTLTPRTIDLRDTLSELTHLLNRLVGEKVQLSVTHDPVLQPIRADKRQLEQVIMNLVVNARDAMPGGGIIEIETRNETILEERDRDRARLTSGDYVVVKVTDNGTGIAPDKLPKIFEPFFTTKRTGEGTGLGLSTAYGIVKQTGGYIFCDSVVGTGTTFTLYFPAHDASRDVAVEPAVAELSKRNLRSADGGVVLLVEDEAPVRAFASRALRLRGYTVIEAENAEEALRILEDEDLSVDVFVTDVIMPGMDGPSWVREALKGRPNTRVVFVSGYAEESIKEGQAKIPNSVFLPKPFSLGELTATVQGQIH